MPARSTRDPKDPPPELHRARRGARGRAYDTYLASKAWKTKRREWYAAWLTAAGRPPTCVVCGRIWTLKAGHLHHITYIRLGAEEHDDLVPLCSRHHRQLHAILDTSVMWRRLGRAAATAGILAQLRARADGGDSGAVVDAYGVG